jgi:phosphate transport system substrate-binding protein
MTNVVRRLASLLGVVTLILAACAPPAAAPQPTQALQATVAPTAVPESRSEAQPIAEQPAEGQLPEVDALSVSGDIVTAGSSTVYPLAERMAERFEQEGYTGKITIDSIGSGAGYERFCVEGETDIANASRPIKAAEIASCEAIGRTPIEFRVGTDALAVVVSADNDFVDDVTMEELALLFSDSATTWSDVRPEWPNERILRFIPGTDSGTFDYFVEEVFDKDKTPHLSAANTQLSEDDNVLVQGVLGSPYAIGYFGYAYYAENSGTLKILSLEGVEPLAQNVDDNSYPLARPLFIYSDATIMQEKPQVAAFINFVLTYVNEEIVDVGYFPASDQALTLARQAWLSAARQ